MTLGTAVHAAQDIAVQKSKCLFCDEYALKGP